MGFKPREKLYRLDFTDTELDGLVVRTRAISTDQFYALDDLVRETKGNVEFVKALSPELVAVVKDWNLENDDDTPVPITLEGLLGRFEFKDVATIVEAWLDAMSGVPAPLDQPSTDGALSLVESLPMEVSSPTRESLSVPG